MVEAWAVVMIGISVWVQMPPRADPEVLLIPEGFTGDVFIVFRVPSGDPPARENGARLYRVPASGIVLTKEPPGTGIGPVWKFFYESVRGDRQPLGRMWTSTVPRTPENESDPTIEVFYPTHGRQQRSPRVPCDIEFDRYFVGTRAQAMNRDPMTGPRKLTEVLASSSPCGPALASIRQPNKRMEPARAGS